MGKERLTAFTDGVVAIIITIMVLELKAPKGVGLADLVPMAPVLLSYVLSFVYVAIYWNNHHHLLQLARSVSGPILWANMHLLFWLSLTPFAMSWLGENHHAPVPVAAYGVVLLMSAIAYTILVVLMIRNEGPDSPIAQAIGSDLKGKVSLACYAAGVGLAFLEPRASLALYTLVAIVWFVPDRRIERMMIRD